MKTIATLIVFTGFIFSAQAQVPEDAWLYGTWINQGAAFEGSFYPTNSWNAEKITLKEDYTFTRTAGTIVDGKVDSVLSAGKWGYSKQGQKLRLYSDNERYAPQGKIVLFDKEYTLDFVSQEYFTVQELKGKYPVAVRFQHQGTTKTFEETFQAAKDEEERRKQIYDENSAVYFLVKSMKPLKKKMLYFDENYFSVSFNQYGKDPEIENIHTWFTGSIANFTDTSVIFTVSSETITTDFVNGTTTSLETDYSYKNMLHKELRFSEIESLSRNESSWASVAPVTFTVSAITALIVAPLISINYKNGDFNKSRYYKTAGIGLIGIGASIPLAIIFRDKPMQLIRHGEEAGKRKWYLEK